MHYTFFAIQNPVHAIELFAKVDLRRVVEHYRFHVWGQFLSFCQILPDSGRPCHSLLILANSTVR